MPLRSYRQDRYVTCLDLGRSGAVYTEGWKRNVKLTGAAAKKVKIKINTQLIYPKPGSADVISSSGTELA
jgi:NADH dehydrogenase